MGSRGWYQCVCVCVCVSVCVAFAGVVLINSRMREGYERGHSTVGATVQRASPRRQIISFIGDEFARPRPKVRARRTPGGSLPYD